jgi:hypothetical protein
MRWWGDRGAEYQIKANPTPAESLASIAKSRNNFVYAVVNSSVVSYLMTGVGLALGRAAEQAHGIPRFTGDIVVYTRPDLLFSHQLAFDPLAAAATIYHRRNRSFSFAMKHHNGFSLFNVLSPFRYSPHLSCFLSLSLS